jgi:hypothetical protein
MNCNCPKCNTECEYDDEAAGFAIECKKCGRVFITPSEEELEKQPQKPDTPFPNFYRAIFIDTWKIFKRPHNYILIGLLVVMAAFKFFLAGVLCADQLREKVLAHMYIAGMFFKIIFWGWFAGIYFNIIYDTAYNNDDLTDEVEDPITAIVTAFASSIGRPMLLFYYAVIGALLPWIIGMTLLAIVGRFVGGGIAASILMIALFVGSLFLFPAAILTAAVTEDILSMRPDYFLKPIVKAFRPYLVVAAVTAAAGVYWYCIGDFDAVANASPFRIALELVLNMGFQFFVIIAMRTIGLYYRHYQCYFPW